MGERDHLMRAQVAKPNRSHDLYRSESSLSGGPGRSRTSLNEGCPLEPSRTLYKPEHTCNHMCNHFLSSSAILSPYTLSFSLILECMFGALLTASAEFAGSRFVIAVFISSEAGAHKNIAAARPANDNKIIKTPK